MTTYHLSRKAFVNSIMGRHPISRFMTLICSPRLVRRANKLNSESCNAFDCGDTDTYLAKRKEADELWAKIYDVPMWTEDV